MKSFVVALPLALAYGFVTSSVHALPRVGINLVEVSGDGVKALPALDLGPVELNSTGQSAERPMSIAQADSPRPEIVYGPENEPIRIISSATRSFTIQLESPLPLEVGNLLVVERDGTIRQTLSPGSSALTFNADRTELTVDLAFAPDVDTTYYVLLPRGSYRLPRLLTPCAFQVRDVVVAEPAPPPVKAKPFPWYWIPIVIGAGVGICALAGCFNSDGGGGGDDDDDDGGNGGVATGR
jgi:hypothetical protein